MGRLTVFSSLTHSTFVGRHIKAPVSLRPQVLKAVCDAADLRESPVGVILLGATPKTLYADAVTGVSKACVVKTAFPGQFTKKEFDADRPFATLNAKLQRCGADPIKWDVIL